MRSIRIFLCFLLFPLGLALLLAMLLFQGGTALSASQQATPASTPTPGRLAKPTLPAAPAQADLGAQVYWLSCLPCHGDKGQGLTEEFRQTYPPEDRYCWNSGCHGKRPYANGFTLPFAIPQLVGESALSKFPDAATLYAFVRAAMPYQAPGTLIEDQDWQVVAFLLRENGLWDSREEINAANAAAIRVGSGVSTPTPQPAEVQEGSGGIWPSLLGGGVVFAILILILIFQKKAKI